jgi:sugar lactone lactonase YvrE
LRLRGALKMPNRKDTGRKKFSLQDYPDLRNNYFYGQLVTDRDLRNAQDYLLEKLNARGLLLDGPGVVYGLEISNVVVRADERWPNVYVDVNPGLAIDRDGRDIVVRRKVSGVEVYFGKEDDRPAGEPDKKDVIFFYLEQTEEEAEDWKAPSYGSPSPCGEASCSIRIQESFNITGRVVARDDCNRIIRDNESYYSKDDLKGLPIKRDADRRDVTKLAAAYADRFGLTADKDGNPLFSEKLARLCRVNDGGGVLIAARTYGSVVEGARYVDPDDVLINEKLASLTRRNIFSNDVLYQIIAEHVTDRRNPHGTGNILLVGKHTYRRVRAGKERAVRVRPYSRELTYVDETAVKYPVTSVAVGAQCRFAVNDNLKQFVDDFKTVLEGKSPEVLKLLRSWLGPSEDGSERWSPSSDVYFGYHVGPVSIPLALPDVSELQEELRNELAWKDIKDVYYEFEITISPTVRCVGGAGKKELELKVDLKKIELPLSEINDGLKEFLRGVIGEGSHKDFDPKYKGADFFDCDVTVYWSAAVAVPEFVEESESSPVDLVYKQSWDIAGGWADKALRGVAVAPNGDVYVAVEGKEGNSSVRRIRGEDAPVVWANSDSDPVNPINMDQPTGVAVDSNGNVYVADSDNERVLRSEGLDENRSAKNELKVWAPGQFGTPWGIAIAPDDKVIYVTDRGDYRCLVFTPNGDLVSKWGPNGPGRNGGKFGEPVGVAVGPDGNVYVVDNRECCIYGFAPDGRPLDKWDSEARGSGGLGKFENPLDIAIGADGVGYLTEAAGENCRLQCFWARGSEFIFLSCWDGELGKAEARGVAVARKGDVYVSQGGATDTVHRVLLFERR